MNLFSEQESESKLQFQPLAARVRPKRLDEYVGQSHLIGPGKALRMAIDSNSLHSMILWGPPGSGKTTFANLLANELDFNFISISAVLGGVKDIRSAIDQATASSKKTILFVDEVHRFNKAQQDAFLPFVEEGTVIFIGATTENPSFEVNNALLSRTRVYVLKQLIEDELKQVVLNALNHPGAFPDKFIKISNEQVESLCSFSGGDARRLLNSLEMLVDLSPCETSEQHASETVRTSDDALKQVLSNSFRRFDKGGDVFYEQISALHKSIRGSDPDASLYWCMRMLDGGCDPIYIARRLVRMASEDIGNADPRALTLALNAWDTVERLGQPEGNLTLAQTVIYLAVAAKSNAVYTAYKKCKQFVEAGDDLAVPMHLRNAPTKLMKEQGMGVDYRYAHDEPEAYAAGENYFPEEISNTSFYEPVNRGLETKISEKLEYLKALNLNAAVKRY